MIGGKFSKQINVCDRDGKVITDGVVGAGDAVATTFSAHQVYTGVGGDKFGIHWSFADVSVVCQRNKLDVKKEVSCFAMLDYDFAQDYTTQEYQREDSPMSIEAMA